jgi:hypothetical protein
LGELALKLKPLIEAKAKENQSKGGGGGKAGCQKSDKVPSPIDTKKELAKVAGLVARHHCKVAAGTPRGLTGSRFSLAMGKKRRHPGKGCCPSLRCWPGN